MPDDLCAACVIEAVLATPDPVTEYFLPDGRARERNDSDGKVLSWIGPYRLLECVGTGGMGEVWRAEQAHPLSREIALKFLTGSEGMKTSAWERFDVERRLLAELNHPNIVTIFDAGETESGRPFFAMEYVAGPPLTEYCDERRLTIRERVGLLLRAVEAVRHGHRRGVIHRDLKPSNILVAPVGPGNGGADGPTPKLIDFGIAKALDETWPSATQMTLHAHILGTPSYMSPEQTGIAPVDTRTDVYGLGAVLYELLTGSPPLREEWLRGVSVEEALRMIREWEPERPSKRLLDLDTEEAGRVAERRSASPELLGRELRDELDWVAIKCLEKEPSRRYESAGELADDLRRYLNRESIEARPPSRRYRARKFLRRHRLAAASAVTITTVLVAATGISVRWAVEATRSEALARSRLAQADAVPDFLFQAFRQVAPGRGGTDMPAIDVLRQAAEDVDGEFSDQPLLRARLKESIGMTYRDLGREDLASEILAEALDGYRAMAGNEDAVRRLTILLSGSRRSSGGAERAILISRDHWRDCEDSLGWDHPETHAARLDHCRNLLEAAFWNDERRAGYLDEVEDNVNAVLENRIRYPGANHRDYRAVLAQLAAGRGDHETALAFWDREMDRRYRDGQVGGIGHYWPASFLVAALRRTGRLDEATAAAESLFLHCLSFNGGHHPKTATAARHLAGVYDQRGGAASAWLVCRFPQAVGGVIDPLFEEDLERLALWSESHLSLEAMERSRIEELESVIAGGGLPPPDLIDHFEPEIAFWLGELAWRSGNPQAGELLMDEAVVRTREARGEDDATARLRELRRCEHWVETGNLDRAAEFLEPILAAGETGWRRGDLVGLGLDLAERLVKSKETEVAETLGWRLLELQRRQQSADAALLERCHQILRVAGESRGGVSALAPIYRDLLAINIALLGPTHAATWHKRLRYYDTLVAAGEAGKALEEIEAHEPEVDPVDEAMPFFQLSKMGALLSLDRLDEVEAGLTDLWEECRAMGFGSSSESERTRRVGRRIAGMMANLQGKRGRVTEKEKWERIRDGTG